ncbi:MAG: phasin family protein [Azonexaceae bacterium]|uniref:phasin family protein n=1 Tax=Azonexus sp. R2A61 TaxID=2744443 RepID=UPI001F24329A|nr:phasin family protein [Azonexus sp. R2A61]MCE1239229.1 phasin family protein [Azonexaceae bacterium]
MSNPNLEQISAAQQANADVALAIVRAAFNGIERLTALNIAATRDFLSNSLSNTQQILSAKDAGSVAKLNGDLAQPNLEKLMEYSRNVFELTSELQKEVSSVIEAQYGTFAKNTAGIVEKATAGAPVGGDVFAAALKSVLNASNQAFEQLNSVSKQLTDIAEANLQVATKSTATKAPAKSATAAAAKKAAAK